MTDRTAAALDQARAQTEERRQATREAAEEVFAGYTPIPPDDQWNDYTRLSLDQLLLQIWQRPTLSFRDKRLLVLGAIAAVGAPHKYAIHIGAALKKGELTPEEAREIPIIMMHYVGQPKASDLLAPTEAAIVENAG